MIQLSLPVALAVLLPALQADEPPATDPLPSGAVARHGTLRFRHGSAVSSLASSADGTTLISGSWDRTVRLWDAVTGRELRQFRGHQGKVCSVTPSPDGRWLASGAVDDFVRLWDTATGKLAERFPANNESRWVEAVAFHPEGKVFAAADAGGGVRLWDVANGRQVREASAELAGLGELAAPALTKSLEGRMSVEARHRAQRLLDRTSGGETAAQRTRMLRALEVLEQIGTFEARQVLEALAAGDPDAEQTREAKATLKRLGR